MKTGRIFMVAAALIALGGIEASAQLAVSASGTKTVTLNNAVNKNQFSWTSDAPLEKIQGTAEGISGTLTLDPKNVQGLRGTISAKVATMKTGNATRDGHLQGAQWLDAAKYPDIIFKVTSVSGVKVSGNNATGTATGSFTLHGVTKTLAVPFKLTYVDASAKTRQRAPGDFVMITADFDITLADYNIAGTKGMVGSRVGEKIHITASLYGATAG